LTRRQSAPAVEASTAPRSLTGECAVVSQPDDEVEFEKKLFAILLAGDQLVSIDNCSYALDSPFMCMVLTQPYVQSRILGLSKTASIPNNALLGANGCNFSFAGDMMRRGLTGRLDAGVEKPWEREFETEDPVIVFKRDRRRLVAAALTVLRGYIAADRPRQGGAPLGGFEGWARLVRDALLWLGAADPTLTIEATRAADPARQKLEAVVTQWREVLGDRTLTTRAIIEEACGATSIRPAAAPIASPTGTPSSATRCSTSRTIKDASRPTGSASGSATTCIRLSVNTGWPRARSVTETRGGNWSSGKRMVLGDDYQGLCRLVGFLDRGKWG
jgi:hypothetical protein